jgi:hypothetical protein
VSNTLASVFTVVILLPACSALYGGRAEAESCAVRGWYRSTAIPIVGEISVPFLKMPGHEGLSVGFDDHAVFSEFSRPGEDEMDVLIETTYPQARPCYDADRDSTVLSLQPQPRVFLVGERKVVVVAGSGIAAKSLTLQEIGAILAGEEKDKDGNPQPGAAVPQALPPGFAGVHRYCEPDKSWCRTALSAWCMQYVIQKTGYKILAHHPFRDDITDCVDGDEVIAKVKRDARGIGFFQYRDGQRLDGVHVVAVSSAKGKPRGGAVAFLPGDVLQPEYPLAEPILLYLHPQAPPLAKEFCEYAVGKQAAAIAAKYGVITAYAQTQAEGEERIKEAAAGTVPEPLVAVVGPEQMRGVLRDIEPAYVRACEGMRMAYVVQTGLAAVEAFHQRHGALILGEADWKKVAGAGVGASGGSGAVGGGAQGARLLASRSVAVVVNAHSPLVSLLPADLRQAFITGKMPDGILPAGADSAVHAYGVDSPDPISYLFSKGVGGIGSGGSGRVKYQKNGDGVIKAVAGDREGMGYVNAADLPADLTKAGVKLLGVGEREHAAVPGDAGYPLSERWYVWVDPQADAATRLFADYLTGGDALDVFRHDGFAAPPIRQ